MKRGLNPNEINKGQNSPGSNKNVCHIDHSSVTNPLKRIQKGNNEAAASRRQLSGKLYVQPSSDPGNFLIAKSHCGDVYQRICAILKIFTFRIGFLVHLHCSPLFCMDRQFRTVQTIAVLRPVLSNSSQMVVAS